VNLQEKKRGKEKQSGEPKITEDGTKKSTEKKAGTYVAKKKKPKGGTEGGVDGP